MKDLEHSTDLVSLRTLERENILVKPVELWPAPSMGLAPLTPVTGKEEPYCVTVPRVPLTGKTGKLWEVSAKLPGNHDRHTERPQAHYRTPATSYHLQDHAEGGAKLNAYRCAIQGLLLCVNFNRRSSNQSVNIVIYLSLQ